jgi:GT2 family glycosyltransferase
VSLSASFDIVVPTLGRPTLHVLLPALARPGPRPGRILIVCDRVDPASVRLDAVPPDVASRCIVLASPRRGPAAARNAGWRAARAEWVVFLDDDVVPSPEWLTDLNADLLAAAPSVAGSQGRIDVPVPSWRRPTDWERNIAGLAHARWATADMAYRRTVLEGLNGFDERFPRAYREDADFGLRVVRAGCDIVRGHRSVEHPIRPAGRWISLRLQSGNADDVLMRARHGRGWHEAAGAPRGRRRRHFMVSGAAVAAAGAMRVGRRRVAAAAAFAWAAGTAELAWARIAPGPRSVDEIITMSLTSALLPFAATWYWLVGVVWSLRLHAWRAPVSPC